MWRALLWGEKIALFWLKNVLLDSIHIHLLLLTFLSLSGVECNFSMVSDIKKQEGVTWPELRTSRSSWFKKAQQSWRPSSSGNSEVWTKGKQPCHKWNFMTFKNHEISYFTNTSLLLPSPPCEIHPAICYAPTPSWQRPALSSPSSQG
jgi:hypothetical protein